MRTITFLSPVAGAGRTTALLALASGFLDQGRHVLVIDASTGNYSGQSLAVLIHGLETDDQEFPDVGFDAPSSPAALTDELSRHKRMSIFDIALIDIGVDLGAIQMAAVEQSDLLIAPFTDRQRAAQSSRALDEIQFGKSIPTLGLVTGLDDQPDEHDVSRNCFSAAPLLKSELPRASLFEMQRNGGHLPAILSKLQAQTRQTEKSPARYESSYNRRTSAANAWRAVQALTWEVSWALTGVSLHSSPFFKAEAHKSKGERATRCMPG